MPDVQPTNNPVPSDNPADARDNFKRIDEVVNSTENLTSPTRTGVQLVTLHRYNELVQPNIDGARESAAEAEASAAAAEAAVSGLDYQGLWPDTGGSANKGDTYQTQVSGTPTGQYFTALQNTTVTPTDDNVNWRAVFGAVSLSRYTDIVFKASGGNTAVDNMISGIAGGSLSVDHVLGNIYTADGDLWEVINLPVVSISDFYRIPSRTETRNKASSNLVDVFLIYGQSNARGTASITTGAPSYITGMAKMYNGSALVDLEVNMPTQNDGTSSGSAWAAFANEYVARTGRRCVFANCAKGSQSIQDLQKGESNTNYSGLIDWHDEIVALIASEGDVVGNVSILFNQGEQDQSISTTYSNYLSLIAQLWTDIKLDTTSARFFLWELGLSLSSSIRGAWAIQGAQRDFCNDTTDSYLVYDKLGGFNSSNGLSDNAHYTQVGYNKMGREGAISVAGVLFDEGAESDNIPGRNGELKLSTFQSWQYATVTFTKTASGWTFNNTQGRSGSLIFELDDTSDQNELRLRVATPVSQYINYTATADQRQAARGLIPCVRVVSNSDGIANDYVGVQFVMDMIPIRAELAAQTLDVGSLGTSPNYSSILNSITPTWGVGSLDLSTPNQNGLPFGAIRGSTGKHLRINSSGLDTTNVRLTDISDSPVNDSLNITLNNVEIPIADVPVGVEFSVGLVFSTYRA